MLGARDTFRVAEGAPHVYQARRPLAELKGLPENAAPQVVADLLAELRVTRFNCPYVLLAVIMNPADDWPAGGGRPLNGGFNTGGGILILSSHGLDSSPNFQSTLQHEVGHAFGLPHVDAYAYNMQSNESIMSYNPAHHTNGFRPSAAPGRLIPEDLRGLALNKRAFGKLTFDPARHVPSGYRLAPIVWLGPMNIPDHPAYVPAVTTPSGEDFGTSITNIVGAPIEPSLAESGPSSPSRARNARQQLKWQSAPSETGWVAVEVIFPAEVTLAGVGVHSQHGGRFHAADGVRIEARSRRGFVPVTEQMLESVDQVVPFRPATSRTWHVFFHAADGHIVVLRGLRFFTKTDEVTPPPLPYGS
jgi:hypothetical protein